MREKRIFGKRYRLRDKRRFLFCTVTFGLLLCGMVCLLIGLLGGAGKAEMQAGAPAATMPQGEMPESDKLPQPMINLLQTEPSGNSTKRDWRLALVNADHPLPEGYAVKARELPNGLFVDERIHEDLMEMIEAGSRQGLSFVICSAYRSTEKQRDLFESQVAAEQAAGAEYEQAVETAKAKVAEPGTSEHHLGLAVDIVSLGYQQLDEKFLDTPEYGWLRDNCWKYGFILRYPEGKSGITGIIFEPWHFRYVGVEAATAISGNGLCLEEYLEALEP